MDELVRSVFRVSLDPGETKFKVKLPNQARSLANVSYKFKGINIIPDFYSKKAILYKLDHKNEDDLEIKHEASLVFSFGEHAFTRKEFTQPQNNMPIADLIKSINDHFELYKPDSFTESRFFIDWAYTDENKTDVSPEEFYKTAAPMFYDEEEFDELKHFDALPPSARNIQGANNFLFPTTTDEDTLAKIRLRIWAGPNTTISFSSDNIFQALGFKIEEMGKRGEKKRFHFKNSDLRAYRLKIASDSPDPAIRTGAGKSKIFLSPAFGEFTTSTFPLKTTRKRERTNVYLAEDLDKSLSTKANTYRMAFGLYFKEEEKMFKFKFPSDNDIDIEVKISKTLSKRLGYGEKQLIDEETVAEKIVEEDNSELEEKARTLVFDTGMTTITMDHRGNHYSHGVEDELVAVLCPKHSGILEFQSSFWSSKISSHQSDELTFSILRFSEDNKTIPLSWKCKAYVEGLLVGKV